MWAVVLAAGSGERVSALTGGVPKQYCTFGAHTSLLLEALDRAAGIVPRSRLVAVVAEEHRSFWELELADLPRENVVVQPRCRGTGAGVLLPCLEIYRRDPSACYLVLACGQRVAREDVLGSALIRAVEAARGPDGRLILLGMAPEGPDGDHGWILPSPHATGDLRPVASFAEQPGAEVAADLMWLGALVNAGVFATEARALLRLYEDARPELLRLFLPLLRDAGWERLGEVYDALPLSDFSRDVLEPCAESLSVLDVPPCGWSDLGTPGRIERVRAGEGTEGRVGRTLRESVLPPPIEGAARRPARAQPP